MGYCTSSDLELVLSQALTTANPGTGLSGVPADLTSIGNKTNVRLVTTDSSNYYIRLADSHINAALSQQYVTPLREVCDFETTLTVDIDEYGDDLVLAENADLMVGQKLVLTDGANTETVAISAINDDLSITLVTPTLNMFDAGDTRVLRIQFPDPIPFISARLAAAAIYDKYATAQQEPGKTAFGDVLRQQAFTELDNIREGRTILNGVERRGFRFANPNLVDRFAVKSPIDQDSTRSSGQGKG